MYFRHIFCTLSGVVVIYSSNDFFRSHGNRTHTHTHTIRFNPKAKINVRFFSLSFYTYLSVYLGQIVLSILNDNKLIGYNSKGFINKMKYNHFHRRWYQRQQQNTNTTDNDEKHTQTHSQREKISFWIWPPELT